MTCICYNQLQYSNDITSWQRSSAENAIFVSPQCGDTTSCIMHLLLHRLFSLEISLEMPVPSQGHYGFHSFPVVDWFCLFIYNYEFWLSLCKIVRSSVILLLPLFVNFKGEPYIMLGNKLYLMTRFALYKTNTLSWIFIVLAHWNKSVDRHVAPLGRIILSPSQPIFGLTP